MTGAERAALEAEAEAIARRHPALRPMATRTGRPRLDERQPGEAPWTYRLPPVRLPDDVAAQVEAAAEAAGVNVSTVVRRALTVYLEEAARLAEIADRYPTEEPAR